MIMGVETGVQWVRASWTKQSRGGVGAGRRNATPVAFPLPDDQASPFIHEIVMREQDGFQPRATVRPGPPGSNEALLRGRGDPGKVSGIFGSARRICQPAH